MSTVLDTNVLSELLRAAPDPAVLAWMAAQPARSLFVTSVTQAEMRLGARLLPAGKRRAAGRPISQFDAQIAAIALRHGSRLATRNVADFEGCGLALVNPWDD